MKKYFLLIDKEWFEATLSEEDVQSIIDALSDMSQKYHTIKLDNGDVVEVGIIADITDKEVKTDEEFESEGPEIILDYKGIEVYCLYKDFETRDSVWDYHCSLDPSDTEGFDVRDLSTYNKELSIVENLKLAIDNNIVCNY